MVRHVTQQLPILTEWDGATLQMDLDGNSGSSPDGSTYRFDAAMSWDDQRSQYQAAYRWQNGQWVKSNVNFHLGRQGIEALLMTTHKARAAGQSLSRFPLPALGLSGRPADGAIWGAGMTMHDRDSSGGPP